LKSKAAPENLSSKNLKIIRDSSKEVGNQNSRDGLDGWYNTINRERRFLGASVRRRKTEYKT
jgi:hypothetical protein